MLLYFFLIVFNVDFEIVLFNGIIIKYLFLFILINLFL